MARKNGGIIGPANIPTGNFGSAPGVWSLTEAKKYINEGIWPVATSGFQVQNSLRFDDGSSDYLSRTPASASNRKTFTISVWVKRGILSSQDRIFDASTGATTQAGLIFMSADGIQFYAGSGQIDVSTNRVFRDPSAWYHIVVAVDTTQATSSDRVKLYVNGTQETSLATSTYPSQNYDTLFNSTVEHTWSKRWDADQFYDGYMAECVLIDGQQLTPSSFGETDATTGNWVPKDVSGLTFGTNGFYLPFQNSAALGQDDSGNGNNFTVNNLTSIDQCTDSPTNNFATFNALDFSGGALSNGNLTQTNSGACNTNGTIGVTQGKWYWEVKMVSASGGVIGIGDGTAKLGTALADLDKIYGYSPNGNKYENSTATSYGATYTTGDIIGVAFNADTRELEFYKNGVSQGVASGYRALCTKNIGLVG